MFKMMFDQHRQRVRPPIGTSHRRSGAKLAQTPFPLATAIGLLFSTGAFV
jgi:hypothetical protein